MKKIIAISVVTTGMLFAGTIDLGVNQENTVGVVSVTDNSKIEQGQVKILGDSTVATGSFIHADNDIGSGTVDGTSTVEQSSVTISNSSVTLYKDNDGSKENNDIGDGLDVKGTSTVTQAELVVNAISTAEITTKLDNQIGGTLSVDGSKVNQAKINIGGTIDTVNPNITDVTLVVTEVNKIPSGVTVTGTSELNQGGITICGNTPLAECGS